MSDITILDKTYHVPEFDTGDLIRVQEQMRVYQRSVRRESRSSRLIGIILIARKRIPTQQRVSQMASLVGASFPQKVLKPIRRLLPAGAGSADTYYLTLLSIASLRTILMKSFCAEKACDSSIRIVFISRSLNPFTDDQVRNLRLPPTCSPIVMQMAFATLQKSAISFIS